MDSRSAETFTLYSWLSQLQKTLSVEGELPGTNVEIKDKYVVVKCPHRLLVEEVVELRKGLIGIGFGLRIIVGRELVDEFPPKPIGYSSMIQTLDLQSTRSDWLKEPGHANIVRHLTQQGSVSLHSTNGDRGYECNILLPFLDNPTVLSKPPSDLIGQPVEASTGIIGAKKRTAIERAIATKGNAEEFYEYSWGPTPGQEWLWKMKCTGMWVSDSEILVITENVEDWQRQYWKGMLQAT